MGSFLLHVLIIMVGLWGYLIVLCLFLMLGREAGSRITIRSAPIRRALQQVLRFGYLLFIAWSVWVVVYPSVIMAAASLDALMFMLGLLVGVLARAPSNDGRRC